MDVDSCSYIFVFTNFSFWDKAHRELSFNFEENNLKQRHLGFYARSYRRQNGNSLSISHLSRRSWQVVLRMSTTPSVLSCLHRMEVAMKQPVRPIPALLCGGGGGCWRGDGMEEGGVKKKKMDGSMY